MRTHVHLITLLVLVLIAGTSHAQKSKDLTAHADVTAKQAIHLDGFNGADLVVRAWDQPRAEVKLSIRIEMSSQKAEEEYVREVRIEQDQTSGRLVFRLVQPSVETGFSFKNLLRLRFNTYVRKEIRGEVFLPKSNDFFAEAKYGKLDIEGLDGAVEVESQSSLIDIRSCSRLEAIRNNYGTTTIDQSGGALTLANKSGKVDIQTFDGSLHIKAQYATVTAEKVTGAVEVESQSGSVTLTDIGADVAVDAPYSTIVIDKARGFASVKGKSGTVKVTGVIGLDVDAPYSTIDAMDVQAADGRAVVVRGQSGKIMLSKVGSAVDIQSPYTNIDLSDINGTVHLSTKSGNVRASDIRGDWTSLTEYSRLTLTDLTSKRVLIENKSGSVDVELRTLPETVEIVNEYADVSLRMPKGLDADVRLKSEYGTISSDLSVRIEEMGSSALAIGKTGTGAGSLSIQTKSGNIRVREQ